jgi:peroxiredoxin Q/BCP
MAELRKGEKAPAFTLQDQTGKSVSLSSFRGKKVLLYFYPKADTPGCTTQSCSVRDNLAGLRKHGVEPLGVSPDAPDAQRKFDEKYSLGFPLLCDTEHTTAEAYGVWVEKSVSQTQEKRFGIKRSSFLIGEDGGLLAVWYGVKPEATVPNVVEALNLGI